MTALCFSLPVLAILRSFVLASAVHVTFAHPRSRERTLGSHLAGMYE